MCDELTCELCDEPADFFEAPYQINNRLYFGPLCERCYVPADVLKHSFEPDHPYQHYQELDDYADLGGPTTVEEHCTKTKQG